MSNAPADWYPQPDGRLRYWDGQQWTDHFAPNPQGAPTSDAPSLGARVEGVGKSAVANLTAGMQMDGRDVIWAAVGKPISGLGAGRYKLTDHYLYFEKGALTTNSQQVPISGVIDVDVRQSMAQKARGVGTVVVHINRGNRVEMVMLEDIPNFREGQSAINSTATAARLAIQRNQSTSTVRYEGSPAWAPHNSGPAAATTPAPSVDFMAQLRQLGELRDSGIITAEEFEAKKADILSRM